MRSSDADTEGSPAQCPDASHSTVNHSARAASTAPAVRQLLLGHRAVKTPCGGEDYKAIGSTQVNFAEVQAVAIRKLTDDPCLFYLLLTLWVKSRFIRFFMKEGGWLSNERDPLSLLHKLLMWH